jgi:hypothetical protein
MGRRLVIFFISFVGLALLGAVAFRAAILEAALKQQLVVRGVAVGALRVEGVGLREMRIADLRLGAEDEVSARALRVTYDPVEVLRGKIGRVAIEGLSVKLDLTGEAPPLGSLQPLLEGPGDGPAGALPVLELSAGRIAAKTPLGPMTAHIDGEAWSEDAGALAAAFGFALEGEPGRLRGAFDVTRAADGSATGNLVIEDGALALPGAEIGGLLGEASYGLAPDRAPRIDAKVSAGRIALPDADFEEAQLSLRTEDTRASLTAHLSGADRRWSLALTGTLEDYLGDPETQFDLSARAQAGAALWQILALPEPAAGRAEARLTARGRLPPLAQLGAEGATVAGWLDRAALDGHLVAELAGLAYPGRAEAVSGDLRIDATLEGAALSFDLPRPARLAAGGLAPEWLRDIGLPDAVLPLLGPGAALTLNGRGRASKAKLGGTGSVVLSAQNGAQVEAGAAVRLDFTEGFTPATIALDELRLAARALPLPGLRLSELRVQGTLTGPPDALAGELDVAVEVGDIAVAAWRAARATAALPVSVRLDSPSASLRLRAPGKVSVAALAYGDALRLEAPLHLGLVQGTVVIARDPQGRVALEHDVSLAPDPVPLAVARETGDLKVRVSPGPLKLTGTWSPETPYRGSVRLHDGGLVLPDQKIGLEGLSASLSLGATPDRLKAEFDIGVLRQLAEPPLFVPLGLNGTVRGDARTLEFSLEARDRGRTARLRVAGRHEIATARGQARIALDPLVFAPGQLQPAALAPPLRDLRAVRGEVQAAATVAWDGERIDGQAKLSLNGLSFDSDAAAVSGLDLALTLDRLFPPGSPPEQRLTVRRIDPGVALEDIDVRFQIQPGPLPRLAIAHGTLSLSGGRLIVRDLVVDPAAERQDLPLEVEGLDLAELFRILDIEGLSGSGRLSGKIPIALAGKTVIVEAGRLEADAPGRLRFRSKDAAQALVGAGESADLMLRALQDFHYDELSLAIDKPARADARLTLVLLGKNPDVLEGDPFRFNINLEGDTGQFVEALSQAYSLSNRMLRRFWRPGP